MKKLTLILLSVAGTSALVACNSGSGDNSPPPPIGLNTSFSGNNQFNATVSDPTVTKLLTVSNTAQTAIESITFTNPNYFTILPHVAENHCTVVGNRIESLQANKSCVIDVVYNNPTVTSTSSANIVWNYRFINESESKLYNTPVTYSTKSGGGDVTGKWIKVGDANSLELVPQIFYDKTTNSMFAQKRYLTTNTICSISIDANADTGWSCFNPFPTGVSISSMTSNGAGKLYFIGYNNGYYIYTVDTTTKSLVNTSQRIVYQEDGNTRKDFSTQNDFSYYNGQVYWIGQIRDLSPYTPYYSISVNPQTGGNVTLNGQSQTDGSGSTFALSHSGNLYSYITGDGIVKTNIMGQDMSNFSAKAVNALTATTDTLFGCTGAQSPTTPPVQKISLSAAQGSQWTALPALPANSSGYGIGCLALTTSDTDLFAISAGTNGENGLQLYKIKR